MVRTQGVVVALSRKARLLRFAFALSRLMGVRCIVSEIPGDEPFLVGKRAVAALLPRISAYPFLFVAEDHAFTGGVVAGLLRMLSFFPYLLVLDAHLDLFAFSEASFPIHRGNFLAYLLKRERFPEDRLFVCSDLEAFRKVVQEFSKIPPCPLYLSWDVDFGFPEVAHFPGKAPEVPLEDSFAALAFFCREQGVRFLGGDLVELDPKKLSDPSALAFQVARCLLPFFRKEERQ